MTAVDDRVQTLSVDTIRCLAMDAVQKANSGHPGTAMALAPVAYVLYTEAMRHDPAAPEWPDRDRFVLSAGHACILQYAALHLTGYDLTMDDLKQFRQWESRTPGHPELHHTAGVNVTTGPLGQGVGNSVGMAIAEQMLAARYNRDGHEVVNHRTFAICSDGDLMEGVSGEASSIAGFLGLGKLCLIYDDNHITIEGSTDLAFAEDVPARYEAYGFHVQRFDDTWTIDTVREALAAAEAETDRPSFISLRTHIAYGAPHAQDTAKAHGAPLGEEEIRLTKQAYGWDPDQHFYVPDGVYDTMDQRPRGADLRHAWEERLEAVSRRAPRARGRVRARARRKASGWLGARAPGSLGRRAAGDARELERLHPGHRVDRARVRRRRGRSRSLHEHADRGCRLRLAPLVRGSQLPLRHPRARDGRDPERHGRARRIPRVRRDVPAVLRLHAARGAARGAPGLPGHLRLDARLDRAWARMARRISRSSTTRPCARS